jgi:hypothetical protein
MNNNNNMQETIANYEVEFNEWLTILSNSNK